MTKLKEMSNQKHLRRQFIHFALGSLLVASYALLGSQATLFLTVVFLFFGALFSILLMQGYKFPLVERIHGHVHYGYEKKYPLLGAIMFLAGALIAQIVFPNGTVVLGALIVLVYGDSISTIVGSHLGSVKWVGNKTLEGTLSGLAVSFLFLLAIMPAGIALAAALIGMLAEAVPLEDNIVVPVAVGLCLTILL